MHAEPLGVGVEPAGAGGFLGVHTEAVPALFVVVKLDGALGLPPSFDQAKVSRCEGFEGGRQIVRYICAILRTQNSPIKVGLFCFLAQRCPPCLVREQFADRVA